MQGNGDSNAGSSGRRIRKSFALLSVALLVSVALSEANAFGQVETSTSTEPNDRELLAIMAALEHRWPEMQKKVLRHFSVLDPQIVTDVGLPRHRSYSVPRMKQEFADKLASVCRNLIAEPNAARVDAIRVLGASPQSGRESLILVIALLHAADDTVRMEAVEALAQFGTSGIMTVTDVESIMSIVNDPKASTIEKYSAIWTIGRLAPTKFVTAADVSAVRPFLKSSEKLLEEAALGAFANFAMTQLPTDEDMASIRSVLTRQPSTLEDRAQAKYYATFALEMRAQGKLASAKDKLAILALLKEDDDRLRYIAVHAIDSLSRNKLLTVDDVGKVKELIDHSKRDDVRTTAISALGMMGPSGLLQKGDIDAIRALLDVSNPKVKEEVLLAFGTLSTYNLLNHDDFMAVTLRLQDQDIDVKQVAAEAIAKFARSNLITEADIQNLRMLANDQDVEVRDFAMDSLAAMAPTKLLKQADIDVFTGGLKSSNGFTPHFAIEGLARLAPTEVLHEADIITVRNLCMHQDIGVKSSALRALGGLGPTKLLNDKDLEVIRLSLKDPVLKGIAVEAIGSLAEEKLINDRDVAAVRESLGSWNSDEIKTAAAKTMGHLAHARVLKDGDVGDVAAILRNIENNDVELGIITSAPHLRSYALTCLHSFAAVTGRPWKQAPTAILDPLLEAALLNQSDAAEIIWSAYHICGDNPDAAWLIRELAPIPEKSERPKSPAEVKKAVSRLELVMSDGKYKVVAGRAAALLAELVQSDAIGPADIETAKHVQDTLTNNGFQTEANAVGVVVERLETSELRRKWLRRAGWGLSGQFGFWLILVLIYPYSVTVQTWIFWNPVVRKALGLGYAGLLLARIPCLRRYLFRPFRDSLVQVAEQDAFDDSSYYEWTRVELANPTAKGRGKKHLAVKWFTPLRGQWVLQGASGLGKTMLLRRICRAHRGVPVFLKANDCNGGVITAVQDRLAGRLRDERFLRTLVHAGAIDILIDGLNEAAPDVRTRITKDLEENFRGRFLLTTQPLSGWTPPRTARLATLLPLEDDEVGDFLKTQWSRLSDAEPTLGAVA
jgi:hypothetical protein